MNVSTKVIWKILKPEFYKKYSDQKEVRKLPLDEIRKIQWNRLKELLQIVYESSDFYHECFRSVNLKPQDIKSYKDFAKLPITDKKILKKNYKRVISKGSSDKDYVVSYTAGSTGEPFSFLLDNKREVVNTFSAFMLNKEMVGIDPFKKNNELMIKAEPVNEIKNLYKSNIKGIVNRIRYYLTSETFGIKSLDIKKDNVEAISSIIKKNSIVGIYGYSSNVLSLARYFNECNINIDLDYIILIAEGILKQQKELISKAFNCPVYRDYGASECMRMGFECNQHRGYHMDIFNYFFEYLDDNDNPCKTGDNANIIVTNLNNYIFPLIRYKIGDMCIYSNKKCSCGLNYPVISNITGRKSELLKTDSNDEISLSNFDVFFEYLYEYIIQYQIVFDEKSKKIVIKIVPTKKLKKEKIDEIKKNILELINYSMEVKIKLVEKIPFGAKGKTKILISNNEI